MSERLKSENMLEINICGTKQYFILLHHILVVQKASEDEDFEADRYILQFFIRRFWQLQMLRSRSFFVAREAAGFRTNSLELVSNCDF